METLHLTGLDAARVCVNVGKKKNADLSCKKVTEVISTIVLLCFSESVSALATYINSV